jgi:hypothetical protein
MKSLKVKILGLGVIATLVLTGCAKEADVMKDEISRKPLECQLEWDNKHKGNWVVVTYFNHDTRPAKIPTRWLFEDGEVSWNAFQIHCNEKVVPFIGRTVKRLEENVFITIAPGENHQVVANLDTAYRLTENCQYEIKLSGVYALASDADELLVLKSNLLKKAQ